MKYIYFLCFLTQSCLLWANDINKEQPIHVWENSIKFGGAINTGNSDNTNLNGKFNSKLDHNKWSYTFGLEGELNNANGDKTAENAKSSVAARYLFIPRYYSFIKGNITFDAFATYDFILIGALGLGHILIEKPAHKLVIEAGPGSTHRRISGTREFQNDFIFNISGLYHFDISETASMEQSGGVDIGRLNTHTEATTAIKTKVTSGLALELSFTVRNDSKVPANSKNTIKTDTVTNITVVYDF
jgi:putative salt-induced outer membrane protein